jgi:hypothetical protein
MHPIAAAKSWQLPEITTQGQMAQWCGVSSRELSWLADMRSHHASGERSETGAPASHYRTHFVRKRSGIRESPDSPMTETQAVQLHAAGGKVRLIEAPKRKLKSLQRSILCEILDRVPPHLACCGFRQGSSILDYVAPHIGKCSVLKMDLRDFFPSITFKRVYAVYASLGFPHSIAQLLTKLSTTATPSELWEGCQATQHLRYLQSLYTVRHLPQGAPTSPALANLVAYRLDCRLSGLAQRVGVDYTRYADDLAFSGGEAFRRQAGRFSISVAAIIMEEGFRVNYRKTRIMNSSTSQRLAGLVINQRPNVARCEYDRLKAILTNCMRHGPESQNRDGHPNFRRHLQGKLAFLSMVHAERGQKLQQWFDRVNW